MKNPYPHGPPRQPVRPVLVVLGFIVLVMGAVWALQGAWVLPATFMRGPGWIGIGSAVALVGFIVAFLGLRAGSAKNGGPGLTRTPRE